MNTRAPKSAEVLEKTFARERGELTVADAAARSGLPLRDAEEGLRHLAAEFGGHLAATSKGEILYSFPRGLVRPPETRLLRRIGRGIVRAVAGVGRFIVRAWVSVVLITYAVAFLALMIALAARSDRDEGPGEAIGVVLRVIAEALWWTFHPFSPVYWGREPYWLHPGAAGQPMFGARRRAATAQPKIPFYEKVNRFVFGPPKVERDPREQERLVLAEVRRQKGRVAPADVMRVTGLEREEAERVLLRLVVDYQGDIEASENGAVVYRFKDLRTTALPAAGAGVAAGPGAGAGAGAGPLAREAAPAPIWTQREQLPALTGNSGGSNFLFGVVNAFNLLASGYVLANGLTIERLTALIAQMRERFPQPLPPADGIPLVLGAIPFAFSAALFLLPIIRSLRRPSHRAKVARENGWRGMLKVVLTGRQGRVEMSPGELTRAWIAAGGKPPSENELRDAVRAAGGEVDVGENGQLVYRFDVLERELVAIEEDRAAASGEEASPGEVVFSSADPGSGIRERAASDDRPVRSPSDPRMQPPVSRPALGEVPERIPDPTPSRDSPEEILARLGIDTRRRGR